MYTERKESAMHKTLKRKIMLLSLPALVGFLVFYILPMFRSLGYSFIENTFTQKFVGFENYKTVLSNEFFQMALKNTVVFSLISVGATVLLALLISLGLVKLSQKFWFIKSLFTLPYVLPSASIIFIWQTIFSTEQYTELMNIESLTGFFEILPLYLLFSWKNIGIDIILITSALVRVPPSVYEAAVMDGAKGVKLHTKITLPMISPSMLFVVVLTFVNSLKIFKESYLYYNTDYPPDVAYMVQNYMNNHFLRLNYPYLSCAAIVLTLIIAFVSFLLYHSENKINDYTS